MQQVTFTAGYGDPTRTIMQKYRDYGKIDDLVTKMRNENAILEQTLNELEAQRTSLIERFQKIPGLNKSEIEEKLQQLAEKISSVKDKIEENRDTARKAWYGFHERD